MTTLRCLCTAALAAALSVPMVQAQESPKPGPEHEKLKKLEGAWETTMKFGGMEAKGTMTYKMDLGGLWLVGTLESELFGQKFTGKSLDTYDRARQKYIGLWVDSMSTAPVTTEGAYDASGKTLTMAGEGPGMDGKATKYKSVTEMPDADTVVMTMYIGGGTDPAFTITYKRKK
jgi:hypothetical protein